MTTNFLNEDYVCMNEWKQGKLLQRINKYKKDLTKFLSQYDLKEIKNKNNQATNEFKNLSKIQTKMDKLSKKLKQWIQEEQFKAIETTINDLFKSMKDSIQKIKWELSECLKDVMRKKVSINIKSIASILAQKFQIAEETAISTLNQLMKSINNHKGLSTEDKGNFENEINNYIQWKSITCDTNNDIRNLNIGKITLEFCSGKMSCKINGQRLWKNDDKQRKSTIH